MVVACSVIPCWNTAQHQQVCHATDRVGAAAEPDQKNAIAFFVVIDDEFVTVRDVPFDPLTGHGAQKLLDKSHRRREGGRSNVSTQSGVVKCDLLVRFDRVVGMIARRSIQFIDVADPLFWSDTTVLASPVGIHDDVFRHIDHQWARKRARNYKKRNCAT
jgi:hypothetical protein